MPPFKPIQSPLDLTCGRVPRRPAASAPRGPVLVEPERIEFIEPPRGPRGSLLARLPSAALRGPSPAAPPRPMFQLGAPPPVVMGHGARPVPAHAPWAPFRMGPAYAPPPTRPVRALMAPPVTVAAPPTPAQWAAAEEAIDAAGALGGVVLGLFRHPPSPELFLSAIMPSGAHAMAPIAIDGTVGPYKAFQESMRGGDVPVADLRFAVPQRAPDQSDAWRITAAKYEETADDRRSTWGSPEMDHAHAVLVALRNGWPVPANIVSAYPAFRAVYGNATARPEDTKPDVIVTEVGGGFSVIASNQRDWERVAHGIAFLGLTWNANQHYWHTARANRTIQEREELLSKITSGLARGGLTFHVKFASHTGRLNPTPIAAAPEERGRTAKLGARTKVGQKGAMTDETTPAPIAPTVAPKRSRAAKAPAAPRSESTPVLDAPVRLGHGIVIPSPAPEASMKVPTRKIPDDVMDVLRATRREGPRVFLPGQLERKLYQKTAEVLESIGAKWKRGSKSEPGAHVFADPERQVEFENLVSAGAYTTDADLSYFATPSDLAERIVSLAGPLAGKSVLEPSAGEGAIVYWLLRSGARVTAVEFEPRRAKALASRYPNITTMTGDFLAIPAPASPTFDAVVMNPPFSAPGRRHADIDHVLHAARFLKPGGTLVSIMLGSIGMASQDKQAQEFREFVESIGGTIDPVPQGAFKESGTMVPTVIVRFTLPDASTAPAPKKLTTKRARGA